MKNQQLGPFFNPWHLLLCGTGVVCLMATLAALAADPEPPSANTAAGTQPGEEQAHYLALSKREIELQAQLRNFNDLSQLHSARAEAAERANRQDQATWERDLARELANRATETLTQLTGVTKDRMSMEDAKLIVVPFASSQTRTNTVTPDEAAYLAKLQERVLATDHELAALAEVGRLFIAQLQTNTLPQEIERISILLEDHGREVRMVQKEMADLELRRLEFRATRSSR